MDNNLKNISPLASVNDTNIIVNDGNGFTFSTIVVEPLDRGFGITLGNSLRRTMLSHIYGSAVTSIKIEGISHEYESLKGVKEEVIDIIMNIKLLSISNSNSAPCIIKLSSNNAGPVMAGSIKTSEGVEIINKDLVICNLNEGFSIDITMNVGHSKGYVSSEELDSASIPVGYIAIDAMFNPIKRVSYRVEDTRVRNVTDYDKLILDIETDGSITPSDALSYAAKIIRNKVSVFVDTEEDEIEDDHYVDEYDFDPNLLKSIEELELSVRSYNCLKNENILYIGDLVIKSEVEMLRTANFGRKSLNELKDNLKNMNLKFGTIIPNWPPASIEALKKKNNG